MAQEKKKNRVSYIQDVYKLAATSGISDVIPVFHPPASRQLIDECEKRLGVIFPDELKDLLLETNGVTERVPTVKGEIDSGCFLL